MKYARPDYNSIQDPRKNGIPSDEPVFLLRAQDVNAPLAVDYWAQCAERSGASPEMVNMAREQATLMRSWQQINGMKVPDLPSSKLEGDAFIIEGAIKTRTVTINGEYLSPELSWKWHDHSPDGFNWGYSGSGPAQLALAIMLWVFDINENPNENNINKGGLFPFDYQAFKEDFVALLTQGADFSETLHKEALKANYCVVDIANVD